MPPKIGQQVLYNPTPQDNFGGGGTATACAAFVAKVNSPANVNLYVLPWNGAVPAYRPNVPQGTGPGCWFVPTA